MVFREFLKWRASEEPLCSGYHTPNAPVPMASGYLFCPDRKPCMSFLEYFFIIQEILMYILPMTLDGNDIFIEVTFTFTQ